MSDIVVAKFNCVGACRLLYIQGDLTRTVEQRLVRLLSIG